VTIDNNGVHGAPNPAAPRAVSSRRAAGRQLRPIEFFRRLCVPVKTGYACLVDGKSGDSRSSGEVRGGFRARCSGYLTAMERTTLFQDDLTEERMRTPIEREETEHTLALDPDVEDVEADDDEDEDLDD
jgi:hypothetical protein